MCDIIQYYKGKGIMENKKSLKEKIENIYEMNLKDIGILLLAVMVCSAIFGFIYEELFYIIGKIDFKDRKRRKKKAW